jgi:uncharacterized protein
MATESAYRLGWKTGERELLVVSVGTGSAPVLGGTADDPGTNLVEAATNTLSALMSQASVDQDISCRIIGRCTYGGIIDRELHDLVPVDPDIPDQPLSLQRDMNKAFLYVRYHAELTENGLTQLGVTEVDADRIRKMDEVENMPDLKRIGKALGDRVKLARLGRSPRADEARVGDGHSPGACLVASAAFDADAHSAVSRPTRFSSRSASITSGSSALA